MEKKYQLVAWTKNIADKENARLYVIPSVKHELTGPFITEVTRCRDLQEKDGGYLSIKLARRYIRVYEQSARFELLTGNICDAIRFLLQAADYCIMEDGGVNWVYYDTDLGNYSYYCGELRDEFMRFCKEALSLVHKYGFLQILDEKAPKRTLEIYWEQTKEGRDLKRHLKEMSAWKPCRIVASSKISETH